MSNLLELENSITDYAIILRGTTIQQRTEMLEFLRAIGQTVYEHTRVHLYENSRYATFVYVHNTMWCASAELRNPRLTIKEFVEKFKPLLKK